MYGCTIAAACTAEIEEGMNTEKTTEKKILFTDMDGTLLRNDSTVSPEMKLTLDRMMDCGHKLVLTSGRPLDSILEAARLSGLLRPGTLVIAYNGSLVYDCALQHPILERTLPFETASEIFRLAGALSIHAQTYTDHEIVCPREDEEIRYYRRRIHLPLLTADDPLSLLSHPPYKVHTIHLTDRTKLLKLREQVLSRFGDTVTAQFSNDRYLEFYSAQSGKGNAIRWVCGHFGIPISQSLAAGDAPNDISMLEAAGVGIAMANASEDVKKAADFITAADNDQDGLIEAVEAYLR